MIRRLRGVSTDRSTLQFGIFFSKQMQRERRSCLQISSTLARWDGDSAKESFSFINQHNEHAR